MNSSLRLFRAALLLALLGCSPFRPAFAQQTPDNQPPPTGLNTSELPPPSIIGDPAKDNSVYGCLTIFTRVLQLVRQDYVDEDKVDFRALTYNALRGMLCGLDPHSQFMEPDSFKDMQDDTRSRYDGLGLVVSAKDGVLIVVSTVEDTPAAKAGFVSGDQILKINGATTEKMQLADAMSALKGKPGDTITLQILRPSSKEVRDFTLSRTEIKVESVKDAHLIDPALTGDYKVGYVRIIQFNEPTAEELGHKRLTNCRNRAWRRSCSTCATTPAACSTAPWTCAGSSCRRARWSSTPRAARPRPAGNTDARHDRSRAGISRWRCSSTAAAPAARRSSRGRSRTSTARSSSARRRSARAACRASSRCPTVRRCA